MFKYLKIKKFKNSIGFTLIELLVTIAIIVILSTFIFANYPQGGKQLALERAAKTLSQDIRRVEEMSTSVLKEPGACSQITGYGIYFEESSPFQYKIYRNCNTSDRSYDSNDQLKETINIESGIEIYNLKQGQNDDSDNKISILFEPPDPTIYIDGSSSVSEASIILWIKNDATKQKVIKINNAGRVEIE